MNYCEDCKHYIKGNQLNLARCRKAPMSMGDRFISPEIVLDYSFCGSLRTGDTCENYEPKETK